MTAPDKRRPLPALVAIAALTLLTALVWFRVLHRGVDKPQAATTPCPTPSVAAPVVLPKPSLVELTVLNSTQKNGLAAGAKKVLVKDGFKVGTVADDSTSYGGHGEITGVGEIRFGPSQRAAARLVSYYLPGATLVSTDSSSTSVIVSLGAKYTTPATSAAAQAAMTAAGVSETSPAPAPQPTPSPSC